MPFPLSYLWWTVWPLLVCAAIAMVFVLILRRLAPSMELGGRIRGAAIAATVFAVLGELVVVLSGLLLFIPDIPNGLRSLVNTDIRLSIVAPLVLGVVAAIVLLFPAPRAIPDGSAALTRRTWLSFMRWPWILLGCLTLGLVLLSTVLAGRASVPDEDGRYTMYFVDAGPMQVGTMIYGWHYSIPNLALISLLLAVTAFGLWRIARPPLSATPDQDAKARRQRTLVLISVVTGALLLHLGGIWHFLSATASVRGSGSSPQGLIHTWSDFAALEQPLRIGARIVTFAGYTIWISVLLLLSLPRKQRTQEK